MIKKCCPEVTSALVSCNLSHVQFSSTSNLNNPESQILHYKKLSNDLLLHCWVQFWKQPCTCRFLYEIWFNEDSTDFYGSSGWSDYILPQKVKKLHGHGVILYSCHLSVSWAVRNDLLVVDDVEHHRTEASGWDLWRGDGDRMEHHVEHHRYPQATDSTHRPRIVPTGHG